MNKFGWSGWVELYFENASHCVKRMLNQEVAMRLNELVFLSTYETVFPVN